MLDIIQEAKSKDFVLFLSKEIFIYFLNIEFLKVSSNNWTERLL
jgi:hypothetical protein